MTIERLHSTEIIGKTSSEAFLYVIRQNPQIEGITFTIYKPRIPNPENLTERIQSVKTDEYIQMGRNINRDFLDRLIESLPQNKSLGINSSVVLSDRRCGQIPMLDFSCEISKENRGLIKELMKMIKFSGFLVESGDSYHFIGNEIIEGDKGWMNFLGKSLLSGLVDYRYIAHGLDRGFNTLRISHKNTTSEPRIIDIL